MVSTIRRPAVCRWPAATRIIQQYPKQYLCPVPFHVWPRGSLGETSRFTGDSTMGEQPDTSLGGIIIRVSGVQIPALLLATTPLAIGGCVVFFRGRGIPLTIYRVTDIPFAALPF